MVTAGVIRPALGHASSTHPFLLRYSSVTRLLLVPSQRSDEPESMVDQKTLEEQERQAERTAMELLENEEAEKQAQVSVSRPSSVRPSVCRRAYCVPSFYVCVCVRVEVREQAKGGWRARV